MGQGRRVGALAPEQPLTHAQVGPRAASSRHYVASPKLESPICYRQ